MSEFFHAYFSYILDLVIFIMVFIWFYFGSGGTNTAETKLGRYGIPTIAGIVVVLITYGFAAFDAYMERGKCRDLPPGQGVMSNDRCYKRIDGPVYVPASTDVFKAE